MFSRGLFQRRIRQAHYVLGLVIGVQLLLWLGSGMFMVFFDIETVRGTPLRADGDAVVLPASGNYLPPQEALAIAQFDAQEASLTLRDGEPVWIVSAGEREAVIDAVRGTVLPPLGEERIAAIAERAYAGRGQLEGLDLLDQPPREAGADGPVWAARFGAPERATLYIDPVTGEPGAIRTRLWRAFDFAWGLHIMDWSTRENFNSWWIKATATFGVLFALTGFGLLGTRLSRSLSRMSRSGPGAR